MIMLYIWCSYQTSFLLLLLTPLLVYTAWFSPVLPKLEHATYSTAHWFNLASAYYHTSNSEKH